MKHFLIISSFFLILISFSMIGYHVVSANEEIIEIYDKITEQDNIDIYLTPYGYTLDNPNIVLNPYGNAPLSAMILFETEEKEEITLTLLDREKKEVFSNIFKSNNNHIIPVYGLYPNTENEIIIKCGNIKKSYNIKTDPLPKDFIINENINISDGILLNNTSGYIYGVDSNNEVRWLYKNNTSYAPYLLDNNNLLVSVGSNENNYNNTLIEIDLMGKIYKQYELEHSYSGLVVERDTSLFIGTDNLIELDSQTGNILNTYILKDNYKKIFLDDKKENIFLQNNKKELVINLKTKEQKIKQINNNILNDNLFINFYTTDNNYKIRKGIKFENQIETKQSEKNIFLVGYKNPDKNYKNYSIKIKQNIDNIQISGNFSDTDKVYIILDKFLDKRVYDLTDNFISINRYGLSGKYSIYIKINNIIYKTNTYVNF